VAGVTVDIRGLPEVKKLLDQFDERQINNRMRRGLRAGVAVFRKELRNRTRSGRYPRKMRATRTRSHRNPLGVSVSPVSQLAPIFEHGAKAHAIPISRGPFAGRTIRHPGMAARPVEVPAFEAGERAAQQAVADVLFEGLR
jgi:hypothetical protein